MQATEFTENTEGMLKKSNQTFFVLRNKVLTCSVPSVPLKGVLK